MNEKQNYYETKYKRSKLLNMVLISVIIGLLVGSAYTLGLFGNTDMIDTNVANANSGEAINVEYESPVVKVADEVLPSIVMIKNKAKINAGFMFQSTDNETIERGTGSGIIYKEDGYIITNQHVIDNASEIEVTLYDGRVFNARVLGEDAKSDLAVIKIEAKNLTAATLGNSDEVKVGELAVAIGTPAGEEFSSSVTAGIISAKNRTLGIGEERIKLIQTDAAINPGNSGGALANKFGEVIGINSIKISAPDIEGMGFAIPINDALPIIEELIQHGYVKRPWIGIQISNITEEISQRYDVPIGVYIARVFYNSPAEAAGLRVDDIITEIDGKKVETTKDLSRVMEEYEPDDVVKLKVYRDKGYKEIEVKLGVMKPE